MGYRLSRITTRTGDDGTTGLGDGSRIGKAHGRIQAMGDVDELNSQIGLLMTEVLPELLQAELMAIQHHLFDLGSELAVPGYKALDEAAIDRLEVATQQWNEQLSPLKEFILPGGCRPAAMAHVVRCVCRRAERGLVGLAADPQQAVSGESRRYLNRLSDYLFVVARILNQLADVGDVLWQSPRVRSED